MIRAMMLLACVTAAATAGSGCSDDVCDTAYDKMESCVEGLNCNKLDPLERSECVKAQSAWSQYSGNKTAYVTACGADDSLQREAEKVADCALDPKTCTCP